MEIKTYPLHFLGLFVRIKPVKGGLYGIYQTYWYCNYRTWIHIEI